MQNKSHEAHSFHVKTIIDQLKPRDRLTSSTLLKRAPAYRHTQCCGANWVLPVTKIAAA